MSDLTTLESVKTYIGSTTAVDDAALTGLITAYSQWVRSFCRRDFTITAYSRWFDGRENMRQMLPQFPITAVSSVSIDGLVIPPQPAFGQGGFRFDYDTVLLEGYRFNRGDSNVQIAWSAGYAIIPADITQAVNEIVGLRYTLRDKQGWSSKSLAGETVSLITKDMPASVATVLNQYRAVVPI